MHQFSIRCQSHYTASVANHSSFTQPKPFVFQHRFEHFINRVLVFVVFAIINVNVPRRTYEFPLLIAWLLAARDVYGAELDGRWNDDWQLAAPCGWVSAAKIARCKGVQWIRISSSSSSSWMRHSISSRTINGKTPRISACQLESPLTDNRRLSARPWPGRRKTIASDQPGGRTNGPLH